jgi:hypothetical protein
MEAVNPWVRRNAPARASMSAVSEKARRRHGQHGRPRSSHSFTYNAVSDEWLQGQQDADDAHPTTATKDSAFSRCRQRASMFVAGARRSFGSRERPRSMSFTNPMSDDASLGTLGPLPRDPSSFFHLAGPAAAYDRSSMVEPLRQYSVDWTSSLRDRPYSVATGGHVAELQRHDTW